MDKAIKAKWVAALRSGEYKQGKKQLRKGDKFCCLGVLCNLHAQAHPWIAESETDPSTYMGAKEFLPRQVEVWADLADSSWLRIRLDGEELYLTSFNDGTKTKRRTFAEIADAIEAQL